MALCQVPSCPSADFCVILGIPDMSSAVPICLGSIPGRDAIYLWVGFSHDFLNVPFWIIRAAPYTQWIFLILQFVYCSTLYTVRYDQTPSANCPLSSSLTLAHSLLLRVSFLLPCLPSLPPFFLHTAHPLFEQVLSKRPQLLCVPDYHGHGIYRSTSQPHPQPSGSHRLPTASPVMLPAHWRGWQISR